jgi:hypothetical protein
MFIKPYFRFKNTNNNKLNELKALLLILKLTLKPIKPIKPIILPFIKYSRGRLKKNLIIKHYLTFINILIKELPPINILVLI